ncbi:MAG TPA: CinA family protein [Burkholderiaceae bacterium]|nr:CinA family protein [Burkholderiaceae bacterium]
MNVDAMQGEVARLGRALCERGWRLVTAESCTGGLIAACCTSVAGSSDWFERGFVTYSNEAKAEELGVPSELIDERGAVSEEVVRAMARGALAHSRADIAVAVTGIAGPSGGSAGKPVGTVWLAIASVVNAGPPRTEAERLQFTGDRSAVRRQAVEVALRRLLDAVG